MPIGQKEMIEELKAQLEDHDKIGFYLEDSDELDKPARFLIADVRYAPLEDEIVVELEYDAT